VTLYRTTITGADDSVPVQEVVALAREYPHAELGILLSLKKKGTPRYPSQRWLAEFIEAVGYRTIACSAHLCGQFAGEVLFARTGWSFPDSRVFARVQLNGFSDDGVLEMGAVLLTSLADRIRAAKQKVILQVSNARARQLATAIAYEAFLNAEILFDESGGKGIAPRRWLAPIGDVPCGYAGGIAPENILAVCEQIEERVAGLPNTRYWIDAETGVRVDDRFDVGLARALLEKTAQFASGSTP